MFKNTVLFILLTFLSSSVYGANPCLNKRDGEVFPYKRNPVNYLVCFNQEPILMVCEDGQEFDVEKNTCKKKSSTLNTNLTNTDSVTPKPDKDISEELDKEISGVGNITFCRNLTNGIILPYSTNCNEFYVCLNGSPLLKRCPNKFYYDTSKEHCVEEEIAECKSQINNTLCNDKPNGLMLPHTEECGKFFICVFKEAIEKFCPKGLHFSPKLQVCTWPEEAECELNNVCKNQKNGEVFPDPENCTNYFLCFKEEARLKECPHGLHFSPTEKHCMLPELAGCENIDPEPEDPSFCKNITDGTFLPYSANCSEFYLCVNETALLKQCYLPLEYNSRDGYCTSPEESECKPEINGDICKGQPDNKMLPHPDDCEKFFICISDKAIEKYCPIGLHFSPKNFTCTWPEDAGCEEDQNFCKNQEDGTLFPHTKNCSKFFFCYNKETRSKECTIGLHFSAKDKYCRLPDLAQCDPSSNKPSTIITTVSTRKITSPSQRSKTSTRNTPIPTAETEVDLTSTRKTSTRITYRTKTTTKQLPYTTKLIPTTSKAKNCIGQPLGKNIKHPNDCTKYIVCIGGGITMTCPQPLEFSEKSQVCDWPERADCKV